MGDVCPYCGKKFKRLKSHLNHCKMAPAVTASKSSDTQSGDALLKTTAVKNKKKPAAVTSRDKFSSSSQDDAESLSDLKTKKRNKKTVKPAEQSVDKLTHQNTPTSFTSLQTTNPMSERLSEGTGQLKRKWQGRSNQEIEKVQLSAFLMETGRKSSAKAKALGKITLAADVLKGTTSAGVQGEVKPTKPKKTPKSKASLSLPGEESGLPASLTAGTVSVQEPPHTAIHKPHPKDNQHFKPSHSKPKVQTHFQEEVKASCQVLANDLMDVKVTDSAVSHTYKVVKTSVWDHIKGGLLSRKYGGPMTVSLTGTKPVVDNAITLTSAFNISPPQSFINPQTVVALKSPYIKLMDSSRPPQASPIQGLVSPSEAPSSKPQSTEWMSTVTAGYHGMQVYRPPGRTALGHEHDWIKPSSAPPPPKPPPGTAQNLVSVELMQSCATVLRWDLISSVSCGSHKLSYY